MALHHFFLLPLSWIFHGLVGLKNLLFDRGLLKSKQLPQPVISVGNLSMGGTGKSPICAALAGMLHEMGARVAVLSRGYGRRDAKKTRRVEPNQDWRLFGDEPVMIAARCPNAMVCVGPTRYQAAMAAADGSPAIYLIDDGFQHRQLARDADIVLIDVTQPMPRLFPLEMYRESWAALKRADLVCLTRWDGMKDVSPWETRIRAVKPDMTIVKAGFAPSGFVSLDRKRKLGLDELKGKRVVAYSGIERPRKFFDTLQALGVELLYTQALGDHQELKPNQLKMLVSKCRESGADLLITTEKDAVKLEKTYDSGILIGFLSLDVEWEEPATIMHLLKQIYHQKGIG